MITIGFCDFWPDFNKEHITAKIFCQALKETGFDIQFSFDYDLNNCDIIIYSFFGLEHLKYNNKLKIQYSGEPYKNDDNADYYIGFKNNNNICPETYFFWPLWLFYTKDYELMIKRFKISPAQIKEQKTKFCSFTVSTAHNQLRIHTFLTLDSYRHIDSGGRLFNNIGAPIKDKFLFDKEHKFSICMENSSIETYQTEKIIQAFAAGCIPIYWGDPNIKQYFNEKAFIDVHDFSSLIELKERIREIDLNDEIYLNYLSELPMTEEQLKKYNYKEFYKHLVEFFYKILKEHF